MLKSNRNSNQMNKNHVTDVAKQLIKKNGLINLSRSGLCKEAGIPDGSFHHVVGCTFSEFVKTMKETKRKDCVVVYKSRVPAAMRKAQILNVAVDISFRLGYYALTRDGVASAAGTSFSLVTKYFGTMQGLKDEVMKEAISREIPEIILQGMVIDDPIAMNAPQELKDKATQLICKAVD